MDLFEIAKNGVVGAGGAGFPTHIKLDSRPDTLIMNAAECEPLLHKDMEMLRAHTDRILRGLEIALDLTGAAAGIIGIKSKHRDVVRVLSDRAHSRIRVKTLGDFYPAGDEITLIYLTTGRVVQPGELPISVGCVVQNVETLFNIAGDTPVVEKFISVAGAVTEPATVRVPIGISYADVLAKFSISTPAYVVRSGGLMMGVLEKNLNQVVDKRTGALIVLPEDHHCVTMYRRFATPHDTDRIAKAGCDQCTFCTEFCPRYLLGHPVRPETAMRNRMFTREEEPRVDLGSAFCCECNLCTMYACPESLDPRGATVIEKRYVMQKKMKWEGRPVSPHPMMDFRKVPTKKLMQRLDVLKFQDDGPLSALEFAPQSVRLPLRQHVGAPAVPIVARGDVVQKYDLIAEANGKISANIHASIDGRVTDVTQHEIVIQRN
ncbi:MAG: 4Fe-4S dicluster domain-containing protein [Candidatus Zhuqueibacterota bacterium]